VISKQHPGLCLTSEVVGGRILNLLAAASPLSGVFDPRSIAWQVNREAAIFVGAGRGAITAARPSLGCRCMPAGLAPDKDFSFDSIADGAVIGFGDLICSSPASII
jgi:hypothetical protein